MKLPAVIAVGLGAIAQAAPSTSLNALDRRLPPPPELRIQLCDHGDFKGCRRAFTIPFDYCSDFPDGQNDQADSIKLSYDGPDGYVKCSFYSEAECTGDMLYTTRDVKLIGDLGFHDVLTTVLCSLVKVKPDGGDETKSKNGGAPT